MKSSVSFKHPFLSSVCNSIVCESLSLSLFGQKIGPAKDTGHHPRQT